MADSTIDARPVAPGEYAPAGEAQGARASFTAAQVAATFDVTEEQVRHAATAAFGPGTAERLDSRQAQRLAEVLLANQPLAEREAALMRLGAFTPRADHDWGIGEAAP